jgi:predicted nucleotidyltransferase
MTMLATRHSPLVTGGKMAVGSSNQEATLQRIVTTIADLPGVAAITLGGSTAAGFADELSDFDV